MSRYCRPIRCRDFDINKFRISELDRDNRYVRNQYVGYPKYTRRYKGMDTEQDMVFMTDWIQITSRGIPQSTADNPNVSYFDRDMDRMFIWLANDPEQPACKELFDMLSKIDEHMKKREVRQAIFRSISRQAHRMFEYHPMVKQREIELDDEYQQQQSSLYYPYCKIKIPVNFNTGDITTSVFMRSGKGQPRRQPIRTLPDLEQYIKWVCRLRMIVSINKFWAEKMPSGRGRKYGITMKLIQVEVDEESIVRRSLRDEFAFDTYDTEDSDNDSEDSEEDESEDEPEDEEDVTKYIPHTQPKPYKPKRLFERYFETKVRKMENPEEYIYGRKPEPRDDVAPKITKITI